MYSGTSVDAFNADDNFQEALLVDPIGDPCGLWKWKPALDTTIQETSGLYVLQPENSVAYQTKPLIVSSTDAAGREIGSDVEFSFFETPNRGSLSAALTYDGSFLQRGIASVCAVP
ncbi:hypothetical protein OHV10_23740 [Vibrio splendidus]|uniref:hypothetical protein n=1 Tax=Vibrio splendidus TaxID=29497 RepID=UPI002235803D|nr:hypothetical protein [Vibrio splendidus]MCW4447234.1 hypothetical protein [Vibrio splendidus]